MCEPNPQRHTLNLHATPESIAAAREQTRQERIEIMRVTGLVIDDEGNIGQLAGESVALALLTAPRRLHV